jgi:hypothetical protein
MNSPPWRTLSHAVCLVHAEVGEAVKKKIKIENMKIKPELARRLRLRGLLLPVDGDYSTPRLKEIADRMRELHDEFEELDREILELAKRDGDENIHKT